MDPEGNVDTCSATITLIDTSVAEFRLVGGDTVSIAVNSTSPIPGFIATAPCLGDLSAFVTVDSSQLDRSLAATYTVRYDLQYTDPLTNNAVSQSLVRTVIVTGTSATNSLSSSICLGQSINLGSLIRDYSFQALSFAFYAMDPNAPGAAPFAITPSFRGVPRSAVNVSPGANTDYWVRTTYRSGAHIDNKIEIFVTVCGGLISPVVLLEGPFDANTNRMRNSLQQNNMLPRHEPYTSMGYTFVTGGGDSITASVLNQFDIVDWVVIEVRDTANPADVVYNRPALLRTDGRVVDLDGFSPVALTWALPGTYYIAVHHRNHLSIMPQTVFQVHPGSHGHFDLSDPSQLVFGSQNSRMVQQGTALMYAGDADGNGQIQNTDEVIIWRSQVGRAGYHAGDFNLNGQVQNNERVFIWKKNVGRGSGVPR
jgi:hypothetical protein